MDLRIPEGERGRVNFRISEGGLLWACGYRRGGRRRVCLLILTNHVVNPTATLGDVDTGGGGCCGSINTGGGDLWT